jgi:hypothetical protein
MAKRFAGKSEIVATVEICDCEGGCYILEEAQPYNEGLALIRRSEEDKRGLQNMMILLLL